MFQFSDLFWKSCLVCAYSAANEDTIHLMNFMGWYTQVYWNCKNPKNKCASRKQQRDHAVEHTHGWPLKLQLGRASWQVRDCCTYGTEQSDLELTVGQERMKSISPNFTSQSLGLLWGACYALTRFLKYPAYCKLPATCWILMQPPHLLLNGKNSVYYNLDTLPFVLRCRLTHNTWCEWGNATFSPLHGTVSARISYNEIKILWPGLYDRLQLSWNK